MRVFKIYMKVKVDKHYISGGIELHVDLHISMPERKSKVKQVFRKSEVTRVQRNDIGYIELRVLLCAIITTNCLLRL